MHLSAKEASEQIGLSKQALINAIRKGKISAAKDGNGEWKIDPSELFRAYPSANQVGGKNDAKFDDALHHVDNDLRVEVATLRERQFSFEREREQFSSQIEDLRRRLDISDEERRRLTAILTDQRASSKRPFWSWLVGRN